MSARGRTVDTTDRDVEILPHDFEATALLGASPRVVFVYLDDHGRLAGHMERRSPMTLGSWMRIEMDGQRGRAAGSFIRLSGRIGGGRIHLEEALIERVPPFRKEWATTSPPRLLVIGRYRMGFSIAEASGGSSLRVFIRYALPRNEGGRFQAALACWCARWCVVRMLEDAESNFGPETEAQRASASRTHDPATKEEP